MNMTESKKVNLIARLKKFQVRGSKKDDCYGWQGAVCTSGFPRISFLGVSLGANRASWMAFNGKIPEFHYVRNTCNNKLCTNLDHLYISIKKGPKINCEASKSARPNRERLGIDLPPHMIDGVRKNAHKRNVTITKYVSLLILNALVLEASYEKRKTL